MVRVFNEFACFLVLLGCCVPSESLLVLDAGIIGLGKGDYSGFLTTVLGMRRRWDVES